MGSALYTTKSYLVRIIITAREKETTEIMPEESKENVPTTFLSVARSEAQEIAIMQKG